MNIYQIGSFVLQIGIAAIVIVLLYGLHAFMEGFEKDDRERLIRLRYARRWSDQEWLTTLKELSDKRLTSLSTVGFVQEEIVPSVEVKQVSAWVDQTQEACFWTLERTEYSIVGETAFQRIPVGISLGEDKLG
jgi:hypothetical protein